MGLDMYLYKKTYVQNWDHMKPEQKHVITIKKNGLDVSDIKPERIAYVIEQVGYWRKANHIHKWFVDNVQNGEDDCDDYYVPRDMLIKLLAACELAMEVPDKADQILPTQEGFFFGGTEYNQDYIDDTIDTIKLLRGLLAESDNGSFIYRASW